MTANTGRIRTTAGSRSQNFARRLARELPLPEVFDVLASELCRNGVCPLWRNDRARYAPSDFAVATSECRGGRSATHSRRKRPPSSAELAPDPTSQQALRFLRDRGELVELSAEVVLQTEQFVKMRDAIVAFLRQNNSGTASELRELLGTSRRVIIPFLERLDRDGVTRRVADKRVLAKPS